MTIATTTRSFKFLSQNLILRLQLPASSMLRFSIELLIICSLIVLINAHNDSGEQGHCESKPEARIQADYRPAMITIDGHPDDWNDVDGFDFPLLPALDPVEENRYPGGLMTVKALHDGNDVFFLLQVNGEYAYSKGEHGKCPSVALMFQVGENASYHNMGGCTEIKQTCTSKTCRGHEVDIMHFSIGTADPGRLYGGNAIDNREGNGGDRFGHLVDVYSWNPHCRYLDGMGPSGNDSSAQNDWKGAWWHDSLNVHSVTKNELERENDKEEKEEEKEAKREDDKEEKEEEKEAENEEKEEERDEEEEEEGKRGFVEADSPYGSAGQKGTYYFEFLRPLRTMDHLQQDAQFVIGQSSKMAFAFWYPIAGKPWSGFQHYSGNCDWVPLDISLASSTRMGGSSGGSWDAANAFSLVLSVLAFSLSAFVAYWVIKTKPVRFTPIDHL